MSHKDEKYSIGNTVKNILNILVTDGKYSYHDIFHMYILVNHCYIPETNIFYTNYISIKHKLNKNKSPRLT